MMLPYRTALRKLRFLMIADKIRQAIKQGVPAGVVLTDAGYGKGTQFRTALTNLDCSMQ